jgi:hypothetical protein
MMNPLRCQGKAMDINGLAEALAWVYAICMRGGTTKTLAPPTSPVVPTITDTRITLSITNR